MINLDNIFPDFTAEILKGGKPAAIGEIRTWSGKKYQKTATGWIPVSNGRSTASEQQEEKQTKTTIFDQQKVVTSPQEPSKSISKEESRNSKSETERVSKKQVLSKEEKELQKQKREEATLRIKKHLKNYFTGVGDVVISKEPNENGKYEVSLKKGKALYYVDPYGGLSYAPLDMSLFDWGKIDGDFVILFSTTSLEGCPKYVGGDFNIPYSKDLTSLEGAPEYVGGNFNCTYTKDLTSLEGCPKYVGGDFNIGGAKSLTSLEGAPEYVGGDFDCRDCKKLKSLEGISLKIGGDINCKGCEFENNERDAIDPVLNVDFEGRIKFGISDVDHSYWNYNEDREFKVEKKDDDYNKWAKSEEGEKYIKEGKAALNNSLEKFDTKREKLRKKFEDLVLNQLEKKVSISEVKIANNSVLVIPQGSKSGVEFALSKHNPTSDPIIRTNGSKFDGDIIVKAEFLINKSLIDSAKDTIKELSELTKERESEINRIKQKYSKVKDLQPLDKYGWN